MHQVAPLMTLWLSLFRVLRYYLIILITYYPNILLSCNCMPVSARFQGGNSITGTEILSPCVGGDRNSHHCIPLSSPTKRGRPTLERAELESTTASEICERLLKHYLALEEKLSRYLPPSGAARRKRSVYVTRPIWSAAKAPKVQERRSISRHSGAVAARVSRP